MITLPDPELDFDEDRHLYSYHGIILPSVTKIMRPMSLMLYNNVDQSTLFEAADRGTRAHSQVENIVKFGVVEYDEDTEAYIDAFESFQAAFLPTWLASEYRIFHRLLRYAGTIDLIGYVEPDDGTGVDLIDLKTTVSFHRVMLAVQLGAYAEAMRSHDVMVRKVYGLQVLRTGKYRFERISEDFKTFLHCLGICNAMAHD